MKRGLFYLLTVIAFSLVPLTADAIPLPKPRPAAAPGSQAMLAYAQASDITTRAAAIAQPIPIQAATAAPAPAAPAAPAATPQGDFWQYLFATLGTGIFGMLAKIGFFPAKGTAGTSPAPVDPTNIKAMIDDAVLKALQSGALSLLVSGGLGMIPGVGPVAAGAEPFFRDLGIRVWQAKMAGTDPLAGLTPTSAAPSAQRGLDALEAAITRMEQQIANLPKIPTA